MEQRQLGRNGPMVPVIGLGVFYAGGSFGALPEQQIIGSVHRALDAGITLIDTAQSYGASEAALGRALKGRSRESYFLATKVSRDFTRRGIVSAMESSLRALQVESVDLYQLHVWSEQHPIEESIGTLAELQRQGKTRHIGVSNYNVEQMQQALKVARIQTLQPRYNLVDRGIETEIIPFCEQEGIGILVHSPLAQGAITGKYRPGHQFGADDVRSRQDWTDREISEITPKLEGLAEIAGRYGKTVAQLAINAVLRQDAVTCVLVGCRTNEHVRLNAEAQGWRISDEDWEEIERTLAG